MTIKRLTNKSQRPKFNISSSLRTQPAQGCDMGRSAAISS